MEFMHGALERDKREGVSQRNESEEGLVVILRLSALQASTLHYLRLRCVCLLYKSRILSVLIFTI